jgi:nucleoside-diphosphate-sugar epimerase
MKRILLTGATGFLGPFVLRDLLAKGYGVRVATPDEPPRHQNMEWRPTDFAKEPDYVSLVQRMDAIVHLAAELQDRSKMHVVNVDATKALACAAEQAGVGFFLYTSSVGVYGFPPQRVISEETATLSMDKSKDLFLAEPFLYDYSVTKLLGEHAVRDAAEQMDWVILRPANIVTEEKVAGSLRMNLLQQIWRGYRKTHHVYAGDVSHAVMFFVNRHFERPHAKHRTIYNVSEDLEPTNNYLDLYLRFAKRSGSWRRYIRIKSPALLDVLKDHVKFRHLKRGLPAGAVIYSPEKLCDLGFTYRDGISEVHARAIESLCVQR